jgi:putative transposase
LNELVRYLFAVAAERHGVVLHALCVLSNHLHAVVSDPQGKLPAFEQLLDSLLARSLNSLHGRWESFWAPGSYSAVALLSPADVLAKTAYTLANPASAGLVRRGSEWPGVWSAPEQIGAGPITVERPAGFFRPKGPLPESASLEFVCPPGFESAEAFRGELVAMVTELEDQAAREVEGCFLGTRRVLAQRPEGRPPQGEPRRKLSPHLASRDKWKRIEAIGHLQEFLSAYRAAWLEFTAGVRSAMFPAGTYWMRVAYGVGCEAFAPA